MRDDERRALAQVQLNLVVHADDVWSPVRNHVPDLHRNSAARLLDWFDAAQRGETPTGIVLEGDKGVGKTHLLRWLCQEVRQRGGWFFLIKFVDGEEFWHSVLHGFFSGFFPSEGVDQLTPLLRALCDRAGIDDPLSRQRICGPLAITPPVLDAFVDGLRAHSRSVADACEETARALVLYRSHGPAREAGRDYFAFDGGGDRDRDAAWGLRRGERAPQRIISELSRLIALAGPAVLAVDQLDSLMAAGRGKDSEQSLVNQVADGLMELRELTRRTVPVVACLYDTWETIRSRAAAAAADRYTVSRMSGVLEGTAVARDLVRAHLGARYSDIGFDAPYDTWPITTDAFATLSTQTTPRRVLQRVGQHLRVCLERDAVVELRSFAEDAAVPEPSPVLTSELEVLDRTFARLREEADVERALDPEHEDTALPPILMAGLQAWILERDTDGTEYSVDELPGARPALHARLRRTLDERTDDEIHWSFRGIASNHHNAVLSRLRNARTEAGHRVGADQRLLVLLRNTRLSGGPVTTQKIADFEAAGGRTVPLGDADLRTFSALATMLARHDPQLLGWLGERRPASGTELFRRMFGDGTSDPPPSDRPEPDDPQPADGAVPPGDVVPPGDAVRSDDSAPSGGPPVPAARDEPVLHVGGAGRTPTLPIPLRTLRQHTVTFAGSGSGKTVLLRRLIEECALRGVSSIVLDPNNDLARLGDRWPEPPPGWGPGDAERAAEFHSAVEVVVWTPRKLHGRPLVLNPLPAFGDVRDDPEELEQAVEAAVAGLVPRMELTRSRQQVGTAILKQALLHFAEGGGDDLAAFTEMLQDLPDDVSTLRNARGLAADMAEKLSAAMINDPLFRGDGARLDPGTLLSPSPRFRSRISVISFVGLPNDSQRQTFVNQLQLALFSWIRRNPAGDRPLGGLLVMDEAQDFAPSGPATACTESTLKLSAQARKYGLGLIFATQAPKGLHNRIPGNAATQFFGRLTAGAQINAATELARRKGGDVDDIARLGSGQFYGASDGTAFLELRMPHCLSHHPSSALTEEDVLERARRSTG